MKRFSFLVALVFALPIGAAEVYDGLAELNADRAKHGLYPYVRDEALTQAAVNLATYRAEHRIAGHVHDRPMGDFAFTVGLKVDATGCAAWKDGFGACEMHGTTYRTAGAAKVRGADGLFYCHLVLRKGPPTSTVAHVGPREYPIMGGFNEGKPAAAAGGDVAVCTQRDSTGKIIREWTEPADIVRKAHGWTKDTPASQCTGCTDCACPAGDCAAGKCPAAKETIQGGCPNGNCPNQKGQVIRGGYFPG